jgi:two-component system NarL family sensor kinase
VSMKSDLDSVFRASVPASQSLKKHRAPQSPLSARLLQAQDEERRRISRELHDNVGQYLVAILMNLETLSTTIRDTTLNETIDLVRDVSREVRTVSYLMHPPVLDLSGLDAAITWYAKGFSKRSGITLEVDILQQVPRLPIEQETALYRVVQECLTNVHRYSGASKAWIRSGINEGQFWLEVEDNGKGLATEHLDANPNAQAGLGVGIPGMRERMREIGGSLHIQSNKNGTKVRAALSLIYEQAVANPGVYTSCKLAPEDK